MRYMLALIPIVLLMDLTPPATVQAQKVVEGKVKKGVYQSPAKNFTVPVPRGAKVSDGHLRFDDKTIPIGAVSFHDDWGKLYGIHYQLVPDTLRATVEHLLTNPDSAAAPLSGWLHEVGMPGWFAQDSNESRVLAESPGMFEEMPALFALIDIPGGHHIQSVTLDSGESRVARHDSRRVAVVFWKSPYVYMLTSETVTFGVLGFGAPADPDGDWATYANVLVDFYRSITFPSAAKASRVRSPAKALVARPVPADAGRNMAELVLDRRTEARTIGDSTMVFTDILTYVDTLTGQPYSGPVYLAYASGGLETAGILVGGNFDGVVYHYHDNGQLWMQTTYVRGIRHGLHEGYYGSGQLFERSTNLYHKTEGPIVLYHPNGAVLRRGTMVRSRWQGLVEEFAPDGRLMERSYHSGPDGLLYGPYIMYDSTGAISMQGTWYHVEHKEGIFKGGTFPEKCGPWIVSGQAKMFEPCPEGIEVPGQ